MASMRKDRAIGRCLPMDIRNGRQDIGKRPTGASIGYPVAGIDTNDQRRSSEQRPEPFVKDSGRCPNSPLREAMSVAQIPQKRP